MAIWAFYRRAKANVKRARSAKHLFPVACVSRSSTSASSVARPKNKKNIAPVQLATRFKYELVNSSKD